MQQDADSNPAEQESEDADEHDSEMTEIVAHAKSQGQYTDSFPPLITAY